MSISDATELNILKLVFTAVTWANYAINATASPETNIVVALHTADPGDTGTQSTSEAGYGSYARVNVSRDVSGWTVSGTSPAQAVPAAAITFPASSGPGSTITHFSTGKSGGGATPILWSGIVTPNIAVGAAGITPQLTTATSCTLDASWIATALALLSLAGMAGAGVFESWVSWANVAGMA